MPSSNRFRHHRSALALAVCAVLWPLSVCASPTGNINLDAINAAGAYAQGSTGAGVRIGILDSGFDTTHIAFEGKDIIKVFSQVGYEWGDDANYDGERAAQEMLKSMN